MTHETSETSALSRPGGPVAPGRHRPRRNKVPEVTAYFWIIKVLFTFALGTAAGDLVSERMDLGYWLSAALFAAAIAAVAVARFALGLDAVWSFWIAYVLTRPLGASVGDYLSQPAGDGALGLGTVITSVLFLAVILGLVVYLGVTRKDVTEPGPAARHAV
ncbi:hypothetical protein ABZ478_39075 [Streptomyces sp. NPDC005706]|uniref:hypothetical protein n=1 Tax=Streptomyces sp. NPDC005706 TaxID=3157169 RepID=UPI0033ED4A78